MVLDNVPRIVAPPADAMLRDWILPRRPVILTNLHDRAPLRSIDTLARAKKELGEVPIEIQHNYLAFLQTGERGMRRTITLGEYLDEVESSPGGNDLCVEYPTPPSLQRLLPPPSYCELGDPADVVSATFVANAGNFNHLHFDDDQRSVLLYQVFGVKRISLIPGDRRPTLDAFAVGDPSLRRAIATVPARDANGRAYLQSMPDAVRDAFLSYLGAADTLLYPGETLFMPALAWHYVEYRDTSLSVTHRFGRNDVNRALAELFPLPNLIVQTVGARLVDLQRFEREYPELHGELTRALGAEYGDQRDRMRAVYGVLMRAFEALYGESVQAVAAARDVYRRSLADDDGEEGPLVAGERVLESDVIAARGANLPERGDRPLPTRITSVGIVGGGTAGYLTALALKRAIPHLDVTLIESSKIPVIGVGEATTALLNYFLHTTLGLDIVDFYERVRPTWKLGIRFEWGRAGDYFFNSPFQFGKLLEALLYAGDINESCLASLLMSANTTPIVRSEDGGFRSLLSEVPFAYHLDNRRFVRYLAEEARGAGVHVVDAVITEGVPTADCQSIDCLRTEDGHDLRYDLYVDCTGFRSLLLGKALGSSYVSFAPSLYTDTAVIADGPNYGQIKPHTVASTMDHGWCWTIPMEDENHYGYVFSSAFATPEAAAEEMRAKYAGLGDTRTIRFSTGRYEEFWRGNCVAIGNSFAFVEPLQSTAIHMIIVEIQKLISAFPRERGLFAFQSLVNRDVRDVWDTLRWFLAAHYRFNRNRDTPFWRACRSGVDVSGIEDLIRLYRERAPIGATAHRMKELDRSTFGVYRYDLLFMGMGLDTTYAEPLDDRATWTRSIEAVRRVAARSLDQKSALHVVRHHPQVLEQHASDLARS